MKAIFIYNDHSSDERAIISRVEAELPGYLTIMKLSEVEYPLRSFVKSTPCLIPITDELQGNSLMSDGADGQLIVTAKLHRRLEEEEREIHGHETFRLDNVINIENQKAIDNYTLELVDGGLI